MKPDELREIIREELKPVENRLKEQVDRKTANLTTKADLKKLEKELVREIV